MEGNLLNINNLVVEYHTDNGVVHAVNEVSFSLNKGEILGLVGETGAGKTTIALAIMQLLQSPPAKIANGNIFLEGTDLLTLSERHMRNVQGNQISMIFQDPMTALNPLETIGAQVEETIRIHEHLSATESRERAVDVLKLVGINSERFDDFPHQFSGGMKQRVIIAIALACRPALLIADEPTTALDVTIQNQVLDLIRNLKGEIDTSVIFITHDLGVVAEMCDRVAVIYAGEIVEVGRAEHIFDYTAHPYTSGLFGSIPRIDTVTDRLTPIPGAMHDPLILKHDCVFADRCRYKQPICTEGKPEMKVLVPGHYSKCFFAGEFESLLEKE